MRRSIATTFASVLCAALLAGGLPGRAWAEDDACANVAPDQPLHDYLQKLSERLSLSENLKRQALTEVSAARPSSDGFSEGGRLDLLRRAFVGLGLGEVTDGEEGQLVFNFNPDALHLGSFGQLSPRIVVHEAVLDGALDEHIDTLDEELRTPARDELKKGFGDLDDIEYTLRWTPKAFEPANDLKEVASALLNQLVPEQPSALTQKINEAETAIATSLRLDNPLPGLASMGDICGISGNPAKPGNPTAKAALEQAVEDLRTGIPAANADLEKALNNNGFTRLADLIEGNPRLVVNGNYRQRSGAAGPDALSIDVTWQRGWVSYRGAKRFAGEKDIDVNSLNKYFQDHGRLEGAMPLFSLVASYSETDSFLVKIPDVDDPFRQDAGHKLSIKGTAGRYFGGGRDRKLELTANYDDVSNDESLHDRFVANLTWVETLSDTLAQAVGGSEFVATLVWANKPEFRGEVDEDFGLRAGLKWSLGNGD